MSVIFENLVQPSNTFRNKQKCFFACQKRFKSDASINAIILEINIGQFHVILIFSIKFKGDI